MGDKSRAGKKQADGQSAHEGGNMIRALLARRRFERLRRRAPRVAVWIMFNGWSERIV